jgi:hypothetical protein
VILDNLTRAFKTQNWFAVATEFVIVIAGVVIGFQINAWNEARGERETERLILCRLASDFEQITTDLDQHRADAVISSVAAESIVASAAAGLTLEDLEALDLMSATSLRAPPAGSPTYAQLVSSGDMALIRSEAVRRSLIAFHEDLARFHRVGGELTMMIADADVFGLVGLSSADAEALPEDVRQGLEARLSSADFYLNARRLMWANFANRDWKISLAESGRQVATALEAEALGCPA